tara:strand:+ start:234 stop:491 length:258 start_codon:yes stop_codon:yes gene_type:complete
VVEQVEVEVDLVVVQELLVVEIKIGEVQVLLRVIHLQQVLLKDKMVVTEHKNQEVMEDPVVEVEQVKQALMQVVEVLQVLEVQQV